MFISLYKYKVESFFGDNIVPFDNNFLCYEFDSDKENNRYLCFKNEEGLQISSWDYLFNDYISGEYWKNTTTESLKEKCIPGFIDMDYSGVNLIINNMFFILDINKGIPFYRKELTNFYCQYQVSHYKGNDNTRLFFLKRLFGEMWIWNLAYDKLSIKNDELIFKAENGIDYHIHDVIDRLCDIIRAYSLPKHLSCILNFINPMLHECIDFILGKNAVYDFYFDDLNIKYIDGDYFLDAYKNNREEIFNTLKNCVRDSQSFSQLFISHMIIMNYSFFVLKDSPDEILFLKYFLENDEKSFINLLSLVIDIGFYVSEDDFDGLHIEKYLEKIEKSDFLLDR